LHFWRQEVAAQYKDLSPGVFEEMVKKGISLDSTWEEELGKKKNNHGFLAHAVSSSAKAFGFKVSRWTSSQPIDKLQECLKLEGALIVGGLFGKSLYSGTPSIVKEINKHPIYSWKSSDRRSESEQEKANRHAIVVIGVEKGGNKGGFVYFVDPIDGSDPQDPLQRKIYVISYENFITHIGQFLGTSYQYSEESSFAYALHYPREGLVAQ